METFCVEINKQNMTEVCEFLNHVQDALVEEQKDIAEELGCSLGCAANVQYLRTRARWTQALEDELIRMDKDGEPGPNMNEFGCG